MSCLFNSFQYSSLAGINACNYTAGGIRRVWVTSFTNLIFAQVKISNNMVDSITGSLQWFELNLHRNSSKFTETLNSAGNYEQTFEFEILRMQPNRKVSINSIIKGSWLVIYQDLNGYYWCAGLESGLTANQYTGSTDVYQGVNSYKFVLKSTSTDNIIGVNKNYIEDTVDANLPCSLLNTEEALETPYYIFQFEDCLVGDLPGFAA